MKTTTEFIDELLPDLGLPASGTASTANRAKMLRTLQRWSDHLWSKRSWGFKQTSGTVTIVSGVGSLPTDFNAIGTQGGVYLAPNLGHLQWCSFKMWNDLKQREALTGIPRLYTIGWMGKIGASDAGRRQLCLYPLDSRTVYIWYERKAPLLVEGPTDEMGEWPEHFEQIIYEGAVWYRMKDMGNVQSQTEQQQIVMDLFWDLVRAEAPGREASHRIAPYRGRNV